MHDFLKFLNNFMPHMHMDGPPKIGDFTPKMDGENNGKPYEQMDDLGVPLFLETPTCCLEK